MGPLLVLLNPHLEKWPVNHSYINVSIRTFQVKPYDTNLISTFCCYFFGRDINAHFSYQCAILGVYKTAITYFENIPWYAAVCLGQILLFFFLLVKNNGTRNLQFVGSS